MSRATGVLITILFFKSAILAQKDSLQLLLTSEHKEQDSAKSFFIRLDFISGKHNTITFQKRPLMSFICYPDVNDDIGIEIQALDSNCFKVFYNHADCDPVYDKNMPVLSDYRSKLKYGDTSSYRTDFPIFQRRRLRDGAIVFTGVYRCRAFMNYAEFDKKKKIYSKWLYINFNN